MENYVLVGDETMECPVPFPEEFNTDLQFEMKKNTRLGNMLPRMIRELQKDEVRRILLQGAGENCDKCVAFAEVLKSKMKDTTLYQWTELRRDKSVDLWAPTASADQRLDKIVVEKIVPKLFILISRDPFPEANHCLGQQSTSEVFPSFLKRSNRPSLGGGGSSRAGGPSLPRPGSSGGSGLHKRQDNQWRRPPKHSKRPRDGTGAADAPKESAVAESGGS